MTFPTKRVLWLQVPIDGIVLVAVVHCDCELQIHATLSFSTQLESANEQEPVICLHVCSAADSPDHANLQVSVPCAQLKSISKTHQCR